VYGIITFSVPSKFLVSIEQDEPDDLAHQILPIWNGSSGEDPTGELIAQQHKQASKQRKANTNRFRFKKLRSTLDTNPRDQIKQRLRHW